MKIGEHQESFTSCMGFAMAYYKVPGHFVGLPWLFWVACTGGVVFPRERAKTLLSLDLSNRFMVRLVDCYLYVSKHFRPQCLLKVMASKNLPLDLGLM